MSLMSPTPASSTTTAERCSTPTPSVEDLADVTDLKFNSAYFEVDIFERKAGPRWSEGGGNSSGQSVNYLATPEGKLIEQIGGNFEAPVPGS